jgi:ABC-type dipeptide/oligopeptide/nickel transport system permease subunit
MVTAPRVAVVPSPAIPLTALALSLRGDGLRDAPDPKAERRGRRLGSAGATLTEYDD